MKTVRRVKISGLGTYVPPRVLTNHDLEKLVETTDEWILQRTGIRERHIADPGVATSDIAAPAARAAIAEAGLTPNAIGFIVVGTTTPDTIFPSTACVLQDKIGARSAWGFDLGAACSGFTYAVTSAWSMVATGAVEHALAVGADVMSSIIDFLHEIDGSGGPALCMPAGGSRRPASHETVDQRLHYVKQDGQTVFKFAVKKNQDIALRLLERNGLTGADLDFYISHQANRRIIEATAERLGMGEDKVIINLDRFGNTTAGTIPLALADARASGRLKKNNLVMLASVGAGFTVGSVLLRWP